MKASNIFLLLAMLFTVCSPSELNKANTGDMEAQEPLPSCEWCGADEAPAQLSWETTIVGPEEPGEPLVIRGTVFQVDGITPTPDIVLYVYHTNSEGIYPKRGDETGNARRHGYLRSWLRTNEQGQYRITTIKPAPYLGREAPAHIHMTVKEPDKPEYWIDSIVFNGDPFITPKYLDRLKNRGGSGIVTLNLDEKGVWRGTRDIILER